MKEVPERWRRQGQRSPASTDLRYDALDPRIGWYPGCLILILCPVEDVKEDFVREGCMNGSKGVEPIGVVPSRITEVLFVSQEFFEELVPSLFESCAFRLEVS